MGVGWLHRQTQGKGTCITDTCSWVQAQSSMLIKLIPHPSWNSEVSAQSWLKFSMASVHTSNPLHVWQPQLQKGYKATWSFSSTHPAHTTLRKYRAARTFCSCQIWHPHHKGQSAFAQRLHPRRAAKVAELFVALKPAWWQRQQCSYGGSAVLIKCPTRKDKMYPYNDFISMAAYGIWSSYRNATSCCFKPLFLGIMTASVTSVHYNDVDIAEVCTQQHNMCWK